MEAYHVGLYYHLEGIRSTKQDEIREALRSPSSTKIELSDWGRIVDFRYALNPLSAAGSIKRGGRFNIGKDLDETKFPPFPVLYVAEDYDTAFSERFGTTDGMLGSHELALRTPSSFLYARLDGEVENVFDLRSVNSLKPFFKIVKNFKLSKELRELARKVGIPPPWTVTALPQLRQSLLDPNWKHYPMQHNIPANPQIFGRLLEDAGYQGAIYPSVKGGGSCMALFLRNFGSSPSFVAIADDYPREVEVGTLDAASWAHLRH